MASTVLLCCPMDSSLIDERFRNSIFELKHTPLLYLLGNTGETFPITDRAETNCRRWQVIVNARNQILKAALELKDWDYALWLDSDVEVYPELIEDLLKYTPKEKVISAVYPYRKASAPGYIKTKDSPLPIFNRTIKIESGGPDDLKNPPYKLWLGFACILIAREVHEKTGLFRGIETRQAIGEDMVYCAAMREAGYNLFLSDVKVNHYPKPINIPQKPDIYIPTDYREPPKTL